MLFDTTHIIYIITSLLVTAGLLVLFSRVKQQGKKDLILKSAAMATFLIHISDLWVQFFLTKGTFNIPDSIIIPKYFCNLMMYLSLAAAFVKRESRAYPYLIVIAAYGGFFGAMISLFYPDYYLNYGTMANYHVIKSMLSHSSMLLSSLWLFAGGYFRIGVKNCLYYFLGLLGCGVTGLLVTGLYLASGMPNPNSMYLFESAISDVKILNGYFIALLMMIVTFTFCAVYEQFAYPKGGRWYDGIRRFKDRSSAKTEAGARTEENG